VFLRPTIGTECLILLYIFSKYFHILLYGLVYPGVFDSCVLYCTRIIVLISYYVSKDVQRIFTVVSCDFEARFEKRISGMKTSTIMYGMLISFEYEQAHNWTIVVI